MKTNPSQLKTLRARTGAGMADCLRALVSAGEDLLRAEELLKEWGLAEQDKRAERPTREGRVFLASSASAAALVELRCETDFVAMNAAFREAGEELARLALRAGPEASSAAMEDSVAALRSLFKENIRLGRVELRRAAAGEGLETYVHGEGRLGVILLARRDGEEGRPEAASLVHDLALQVAAFKPLFIDLPSVPSDYLATLEAELRRDIDEEGATKGKSEAIRARMLEGRLRKRLAAVCLSEQAFLKDESRRVAELLAELREGDRPLVEVRGFVRIAIDDEESSGEPG